MTARLHRIEVSTLSPASRTYSIAATGPTFKSRTYAVSATAPETPQPHAGSDIKDLEPWHRISLIGTETSSVGPSIARKWTQTSGTPVQILDADKSAAYYWAPGSPDGETLEFGYQIQGPDETWSPVDHVRHSFFPSAEYSASGGNLKPMGMIAVTSGFSLGNLTQ